MQRPRVVKVRPALPASLGALIGVAAVLVASAKPAAAFERQHRVGIGLGLAALKIDDKDSLSTGVGASASYTYGLSDQFNFVVEGGYARVATREAASAGTPRTRPTDVSNLGVGFAYVLDVLRWVPYFGVLGTGYLLTGGTLDKPTFVPGAQLALGLDYHLDRSWAVGVSLRQHMLLGKWDTYPTYTTMFARAEYVWGW